MKYLLNAFIITYIGLCFTDYGMSHGGHIIGSMFILCYATIAIVLVVSFISNIFNKG